MPTSEPLFRTLHALRIKDFAKADTVAAVAALPLEMVEAHLAELRANGWAVLREARQLWQLTPRGVAEHVATLSAEAGPGVTERLRRPYAQFLELNDRFKVLCGEWQQRGGAPNDHRDEGYDRAVLGRLADLHDEVARLVDEMAGAASWFAPYSERLASTCRRVLDGETNMFTGVMCGSYHDVWLELHEDLILTQGIDRQVEGSY